MFVGNEKYFHSHTALDTENGVSGFSCELAEFGVDPLIGVYERSGMTETTSS